MASRRLASAFFIALFIAGICTLLLHYGLAQQRAHTAVKRYAAASRALNPGEVVTAEALHLVSWPAELPLAGGLAKTSDITGRLVLYPIEANQPIIERDLAMPGSGVGLTPKIRPGMRAVALHVDEVVGVAGFLFPGSHVDVLVTYRPQQSGLDQARVTDTVVQDAEILASGENMLPDPQGRPTKASVVTLLLVPADAERVVLASSEGSIHFVLRNGRDHDQVSHLPVQLEKAKQEAIDPTMLAQTHLRYVQSSRLLKGNQAAHNRRTSGGFIVETVLGEKRSESSFTGSEARP